MSLISTEEFYAEAPDSISEPSVTLKDPHAQRLARLQWELKQRRKLQQEADDRETERDKLELVIRSQGRIFHLVQTEIRETRPATPVPVWAEISRQFGQTICYVRSDHQTVQAAQRIRGSVMSNFRHVKLLVLISFSPHPFPAPPVFSGMISN